MKTNLVQLTEEDGRTVYLSYAAKGIVKNQRIPLVRHDRRHSTGTKIRVSRQKYAQAEDSFRLRVQNQLQSFLSKDLTEKQFEAIFEKELREFHLKMYSLGKHAIGKASKSISVEEKRWLHGQHSLDMRHMHKFIRDMRQGKGRMKYDHRMDLYALGGTSIYFRAAVYASDPGSRWSWDLSDAEHCLDCVNRNKKSEDIGGFTREQILGKVGTPGQYTRCMHRCRCGLSLLGDSLVRLRPTSFTHVQKMQRGV